MNQIYNFYPTLLNCFQDYLDSDNVWYQYWGRSRSPKKTIEGFKREKFQILLDTINKVPGESNIYADKGTAFNELIDCMIEGRNSMKMIIQSDRKNGNIIVKYMNYTFHFPLKECVEAADYFRGAKCQVKVDSTVQTNLGDVHLSGYIDQLRSPVAFDMKTVKKYEPDKFIRNWQHSVYLHCLNQAGLIVNEFIYKVYVMDEVGKILEIHEESYIYNRRDLSSILFFSERLISFIEEHRKLITNNKIFQVDLK